MHIAFVDFQKAFDTIGHNYLWKAMKNQGYTAENIEIIKEMYNNTRAYVHTDVEGNEFEIERGVKQGDPLSSVLFNIALQEIFRGLNWEEKGIKVNGKYLSHLRFADDIVILSNTKGELETMMNELHEKSKIARLGINVGKTHIIADK